MTRIAIPDAVLPVLDALAARRGLTRQQTVVRAIGVLQDCEAAAMEGFDVGVGERLERVVVGKLAK